ncbi:glycosyltransferase [Lysobacter sp. MMG2]|uniref:glycosyltransferase n=1 Tax=Lysobacter sp. MMG2 TaxID=2801338 RepID=UPI001C22BA45|nr:glycosyltransferase [Lysobacter sp. MMG2]MBU8976237.1 glycosyltransferase [Lysobacter sp. MMG2]
MKFLFVGSSPDHGGAEVHFIALAQALLESGHRVEAMVHPHGFIADELERLGIRPRRIAFRNAVDPLAHAALIRTIRAVRPDALVANFGKDYWPLILAGRLLRVPVLLFRHRVAALKPASGWLLPRLARGFFAVSDFARSTYLGQGIAPERVQVLHNPIDLKRYRFAPDLRREVRASLGIDDNAVVVGYCGRMLESKGIYTLFEATSSAMEVEPSLHCLWVGESLDGDRLRARVAGSPHASRHHFVGLVDDPSPYYSAFSLLAFPSIAPETFGRVSIEAQACGIPVLGSDVGGVPETLIDGKTGLLLPPDDAVAWRDAILRLCDANRRAALGEKAREFVKSRFSYPIIAEQLVSFLDARGT